MDIDKVCTEEIKFVLRSGQELSASRNRKKENISKWVLPDECGSTAVHTRCREIKLKVGVNES